MADAVSPFPRERIVAQEFDDGLQMAAEFAPGIFHFFSRNAEQRSIRDFAGAEQQRSSANNGLPGNGPQHLRSDLVDGCAENEQKGEAVETACAMRVAKQTIGGVKEQGVQENAPGKLG